MFPSNKATRGLFGVEGLLKDLRLFLLLLLTLFSVGCYT